MFRWLLRLFRREKPKLRAGVRPLKFKRIFQFIGQLRAEGASHRFALEKSRQRISALLSLAGIYGITEDGCYIVLGKDGVLRKTPPIQPPDQVGAVRG